MSDEFTKGILREHTEEATFLWTRRTLLAQAPHCYLASLTGWDDRLDAHLDGLELEPDLGWSVLETALLWENAEELFVGARLAFRSNDRAWINRVLAIIGENTSPVPGVISALGWLPYSEAGAHIRWLVQSGSPALRRVGIAGYAIHRQNPGDTLRDSLRSEDLLLKARACKAVGELGRSDLASQTSLAMPSEDALVRFWSAWSTALLTGSANALSVLESIAESPGPRQIQAMQMLARRAPAETKDWQRKLAQNPQHLRLALIAAGESGDPAPVPFLIEKMKVPPLARVAGEAFTTITGVDLSREHLDGKKPEGFEAGPNDNPEDENVAMDEDEDLPWPEPALVQKWWERNRSQFQNGTRYLLGKPMTTDWLRTVLRDGRQRQRAAAALELAIRNPGQPLFNVKAPGFRQIEALGKPGPVIR